MQAIVTALEAGDTEGACNCRAVCPYVSRQSGGRGKRGEERKSAVKSPIAALPPAKDDNILKLLGLTCAQVRCRAAGRHRRRWNNRPNILALRVWIPSLRRTVALSQSIEVSQNIQRTFRRPGSVRPCKTDRSAAGAPTKCLHVFTDELRNGRLTTGLAVVCCASEPGCLSAPQTQQAGQIAHLLENIWTCLTVI